MRLLYWLEVFMDEGGIPETGILRTLSKITHLGYSIGEKWLQANEFISKKQDLGKFINISFNFLLKESISVYRVLNPNSRVKHRRVQLVSKDIAAGAIMISALLFGRMCF